MKPTTAVIFAAGTGTRMLPVTSAVQKELLPIVNRPVIDYVVSDLVAAGVKRIIFVTRPGARGLQDYYVGNDQLKRALERLGKTEALAQLDKIHREATFEFIEQPENAGYGTAIPLQIALPTLSANETIIACGGDDFVWHSDGSSEMTRFIETFRAMLPLISLTSPNTSSRQHYTNM
jgi:UTP-glucose-1-phosphate uridylyltransferase